MGLLPQLQAGFFQQALFRQKYICLMRKGHPLAAGKKLTLSSFTQAEHVRIVAAGTGHGRVDVALEKQKFHRQFRLTVPHYVALGDVLSHSDLMATVPERFADRHLVPFGLIKRDLPIPVAESAIHQFWHSRLHRDPGHQLLRRFTCALFGDVKVSNEEMPI
jgi:DNA-binding transcriptional LysR family regulator